MGDMNFLKNFDLNLNVNPISQIYIYREKDINRKFWVNGFEFYEVF